MKKVETKLYDIAFSELEMAYLEYFLNEAIKQCFPKTEDGISPIRSCKNGVFYKGSEDEKHDVLKRMLHEISIKNRTL